jgi:hypothetical protein
VPGHRTRCAGFSSRLRWPGTARDAIATVGNGGTWRERGAEAAGAPLDRADRRTGEGGARAAGGPSVDR